MFVSPANIDSLRDALKENPVKNLDLAVDILDGNISYQNVQGDGISRFDFDQIEKTRLDIEEQSAQIVHGVRISRINYSKSLLYSALLNRLGYTLIDDYQRGLEILNFENRPFVWIPKYSLFNHEIGLNRLPASVMLFRDNLKRAIRNDFNLGRLITFYTNDIAKDSLKILNDIISDFQSDMWASFNFNQIQKWVLDRNYISINLFDRIDNLNKKNYSIVIKNKNDNLIEKISIHLDFPKSEKYKIESVKSTTEIKDSAFVLNDKNDLQIAHMAPQSEVIVDLKSISEGEK